MANGERTGGARDCGLLIIRLGLGICFIFHGWHKLKKGPDFWTILGQSAHMPQPKIMGFIGTMIEFGGGILLAAGLFTKPAALLLFLQMCVAVFLVHMRMSPPMNSFEQGYSHALEDGFVFLGLLFLDGGKFSVDRKLFG